MEILIIAITIILPLLIGFVLGESRDNNQIIFNKKLGIYSDIIYHLSSAKYLRLNLNISTEKLKSLYQKINNTQEKSTLKFDTDLFNSELKNISIDRELENINYKDELIKLFAPARLIGSVAVVEELRNYYSLISEYHEIKEKRDIDDLSREIARSTMELEQLMRKDLGYFRIISKLDIWWHLRKMETKLK